MNEVELIAKQKRIQEMFSNKKVYIKMVVNNYFLFEDTLPIMKLNETAAFILERVIQQKKISDIIKEVSFEYNIDEDSAKKDIFEFLTSF